MGVRKTHAQLFAEKMERLHKELATDKLIRQRERKEHRNEWRRQYRLKKKQEPALKDGAAHNLAVLCADRGEQKRAGTVRWTLGGASHNLAEWCEIVFSASGVKITPVELEDAIMDSSNYFRGVDELIAHLQNVHTSAK